MVLHAVKKDEPEPTKGGETLAARIEWAATMSYLEGATLEVVGNELGVSPLTVRDWKQRPEWAAAIRALRDTQRQLAHERLSALTTKALEVIEHSLDSPKDRLRAAIWIMERSAKLFEDGAEPRNAEPSAFQTYLREAVVGDAA